MTRVTVSVVEARLAGLQDLGRVSAHLGLATNGALDQHAVRMANALVGNPLGSAVIETVLSPLKLSFDADAVVAVTGAPASVRLGSGVLPNWQPVVIPAGGHLTVDAPARGARVYIAIGGDWRVPEWACSVAPDPALGFGVLLSPGDEVVIANANDAVFNPTFGTALFRLPVTPPAWPDETVLDVMDGPDAGTVPGLRAAIESGHFTVGMRSDHVGVRLTGALPSERPIGEVLSHGVAIGAVELPPSDELIVLQRGRSLTAGYPVVGVVSRVSLDRLGQVVPGQQIRMRWRSREDCVADARRQARDVARVATAMRSVIDSLHARTGVAP